MRIEISENYHALRRSELELTADYLSKVEQEKDRQRALREQQREDRKVEEEIARKQAQLDKERQRYTTALAQLEAGGDTAAAAQVRAQLTSVTAALAGLAQRGRTCAWAMCTSSPTSARSVIAWSRSV